MQSSAFEQTTIAGQIVASFNSKALSEETCRRALLPLLRPDWTCPTCGVSYNQQQIDRAMSGKDVICADCNRKATPRSGTVLDGVHCGYREVLLVAIMLHWKISRKEIANRTGISDDTVSRLAKRLGVSCV